MEAILEQLTKTLEIPRTAMQVFEMLPEGTQCEVINNVLYMSPAENLYHQKLSRLLLKAIEKKLDSDKIAGELFYAPVDVFFDQDNVFQPDIVFVSKENAGLLNWEKALWVRLIS